MRVTNSMLASSFLTNLNRNMSAMSKYQNQLSSGRRITRLSDDPIGVMASIDARGKLSRLNMYSNAIGDAKSWLQQTETALTDINGTLLDISENTVRAANGTLSADDKKAVSATIEQLKQHIVSLGNSTYGGRYIFGGFNTTQEPFQKDASGTLKYNGEDLVTASAAVTGALGAQTIRYATGVNVNTDVSINGVQLMGTGSDNLVKILDDLTAALNSDAPSSDISAFIGKVNGKRQDVLSLLADVGGRSARLDAMENNNATNEITYTDELSKVEDVDQGEATIQFKMAEAVYRSALAVGAQVIKPTLLDFLR